MEEFKMNNDNNNVVYDNSNDNYPHFSDLIKERFNKFKDKPLFTTNSDGLFEAFLNNMPSKARQHYNCRECGKFIDRFGGLVSISEKGEVSSILWDENNTPEFFEDSVKAMKKILLNSNVTGIFISGEKVLGQPSTNGWEHMSVTIPKDRVFTSSFKTPFQEMAGKIQDFETLVNGLNAFSLDAFNTAVVLLETNSLSRSSKFLNNAKFLQELCNNRLKTKKNINRDNITWLAVATNPSDFCHVKSGMIGSLLDDITDGLPTSSIISRFDEKMRPDQYMRSQVAPTEGNKQQAERIVEQRGIANSLSRRFPSISEIPEFIWQNKKIRGQRRGTNSIEEKSNGVFGSVKTKEKVNNASNIVNLPNATTMTFAKFQKTIMPTAESIEVMTDNINRFMALVTASDETAPNILKWGNTFSWYYHGGIDGEIQRRVENAGGQHKNNEIRCSLIWEGYTDLDLHCLTPRGKHIYYSEKRYDNGVLDVDANGIDGKTLHPVENIRWGNGLAIEGHYQFYVHNFDERSGNRSSGSTPFKIELEINGRIYSRSGTLRHKNQIIMFEFDYRKGQHPTIRDTDGTSYSSNSQEEWNVPTNSFVKVNGITTSPNLWDGQLSKAGHHIFFLLDGCKDLSEGKGRGFFPEMLKSEFLEIRKTLEAFTANTPIEDVDNASACGVGYSTDSEWNVTIRVTSNNSTQIIKIDRWD
jgi:hypothetical protein